MTTSIKPGQIWIHSRRGSSYEIEKLATLQVKNKELDNVTCVIYRPVNDRSQSSICETIKRMGRIGFNRWTIPPSVY